MRGRIEVIRLKRKRRKVKHLMENNQKQISIRKRNGKQTHVKEA